MCERVNRLTGREPHGIVDQADKYELEEQIISDLYSIRSDMTMKILCLLPGVKKILRFRRFLSVSAKALKKAIVRTELSDR